MNNLKHTHWFPHPADLRNDRRMKQAMKDLPVGIGNYAAETKVRPCILKTQHTETVTRSFQKSAKQGYWQSKIYEKVRRLFHNFIKCLKQGLFYCINIKTRTQKRLKMVKKAVCV